VGVFAVVIYRVRKAIITFGNVFPNGSNLNQNFTFSEVIDFRLKDLNWTKSDLARRVGVTSARIRGMLRQESISELVFRKVLFVLGLEIDIMETCRPKPPEFFKKKNSRMRISSPPRTQIGFNRCSICYELGHNKRTCKVHIK